MLRRQVYAPLLDVERQADRLSRQAFLVYYAPRHCRLGVLEIEIAALERALEDLRIALQAIRSRGDDPLADDVLADDPLADDLSF